jgi:hypothetical protein
VPLVREPPPDSEVALIEVDAEWRRLPLRVRLRERTRLGYGEAALVATAEQASEPDAVGAMIGYVVDGWLRVATYMTVGAPRNKIEIARRLDARRRPWLYTSVEAQTLEGEPD